MKPTYVIKGWNDHFETAESRKLNRTRWVPMPTKHDGKGYRRVAQHENAVAIFCGWNLIVQVASKTPVRGILADEDGPLDAEDLAAMTGFPAEIFSAALEFLSSDRIGWLSTEEQKKKRVSARVRQNPPESAANDSDPSLEGKGKERKRKEEVDSGRSALVYRVFDFWKEQMNHPGAQLTADRKKKIEERLVDSTVEEIEDAIRGCFASDFHMGREPGKPDIHDDIELICRKRSKLEMFIEKQRKAQGALKAVDSMSPEEKQKRQDELQKKWEGKNAKSA
jgi:hypothetical protein